MVNRVKCFASWIANFSSSKTGAATERELLEERVRGGEGESRGGKPVLWAVWMVILSYFFETHMNTRSFMCALLFFSWARAEKRKERIRVRVQGIFSFETELHEVFSHPCSITVLVETRKTRGGLISSAGVFFLVKEGRKNGNKTVILKRDRSQRCVYVSLSSNFLITKAQTAI